MPLGDDRLPNSSQEITSLVFVSVIAAFAAVARILYGKNPIGLRYAIASIMCAMTTAVMVYGVAIHYFGPLGGHASAALGAGVGLFTDEVLKRSKDYIDARAQRAIRPKD